MLGSFLLGAGSSIAFGAWQGSVEAGIFAWNFVFFIISLIDYAKRPKQ